VTLRIGLDLEPGLVISRVLTDLDLLDIAYAATHGGAQSLLAPIAIFGAGTPYSADLFFRPGLPLFMVKAELDELDKVLAMGNAPDRVLVTGDRGRPLQEFDRLTEFAKAVKGFSQEIGALVEPEALALRELARARVQWVFFSTEPLVRAAAHTDAEAELARLTSAAVAAGKLGQRVALCGPTGRHLPSTFASIPHLEEIYPTPDLWNHALRLGWERALAEYRTLL